MKIYQRADSSTISNFLITSPCWHGHRNSSQGAELIHFHYSGETVGEPTPTESLKDLFRMDIGSAVSELVGYLFAGGCELLLEDHFYKTGLLSQRGATTKAR
jgi:hypothetical protein